MHSPGQTSAASITLSNGGSFTTGTGTLSLAILQDFAASAPNALLGLNGSVFAFGAAGFVEVRPTSSARCTEDFL